MKNNQIESIKIKTFGNIVLIILWMCLIFIVIKGSISIINPVKISSSDIKIENSKENSKKILEDNAVSFAENFSREYMTNNGDEDDYQKRIESYINKNMEFKNLKIFSVSYVNSINRKWVGKNNVLVDCIVKGSAKKTPGNDNLIQNEEVFYIRNAVTVLDGNFVIASYPTFISDPTAVYLKNEDSLKGSELDDNNKKLQIEKIVRSFLKAYYEGQNTEIQYFVENSKIKEGKKPFEFFDLNEIKINWDRKNEYYVKTSFFVSRNENNFIQSMEFSLKVKDNKFVITSYNTKL